MTRQNNNDQPEQQSEQCELVEEIITTTRKIYRTQRQAPDMVPALPDDPPSQLKAPAEPSEREPEAQTLHEAAPPAEQQALERASRNCICPPRKRSR